MCCGNGGEQHIHLLNSSGVCMWEWVCVQTAWWCVGIWQGGDVVQHMEVVWA